MVKSLKIFAVLSAAVVIALGLSSPSHAVNSLGQGACTSAGYSTTYSGACSGDAASASSAVTSAETVAIGASQTIGLISNRIGALASSQNGSNLSYNNGHGKFSYNLSIDETGKAAGGADQKWGVWVNGAWSRTLFNDNSTSYAGNTINTMGGADYRVSDELLVGLAVGYETTDNKTTFNRGNEDSSGWTTAAYAVFDLGNAFTIDVTGGYSALNYEMDRKDALVSSTIKGETDADRVFGAANLNGSWTEGQWEFGTRAGVLYAKEEKDGFTETGEGATTVAALSTTVGRASLGGSVGYAFDDVTPYVKANYNFDFKDGGSSDSNFLDYGLGIRLNMGNGVSGGLEGTGIVLKDDLQSYGANATVRVEF